ncbi:Rne/Rng family ribonuclease [Uliginosibacterium sp. H3]|uniref:Ribonuclease E n=1 Tax=Uliginosibacterium silvisoli TaxID=3114758 RepID=A0ABU6K533_9RHOO|nr:Rne/Rng family ribonuclease [Uliginosibacterium sp. H3]
MKRMLFNATQAEELRVAIVDGQKLIDLDIESAAKEQRKSNIYKGVITRIEPSLEAAFVDYGAERHGFLPFKEVSRSFFREGVNASSATIKEALREGQEIIVQVEKEERGNKGAALTTFVSLAGRYLVLMPNNPRGGGVSRRIEGDDRAELREAMDSLEVPNGMSLIARTAAIGHAAEELQWDLNYLMQLWTAIDGAAKSQTGAFLIYQEGSLVIRAIRDYFQPDIGEILIDTDEIYEQARQFMAHVMPANVHRVKRYRDDVPLFSRFQIEHQIESAYSRQVNLPSGGAIVIDHTEALVSVDVNSGRATKGSDIEETALRTNSEAADEIARQLRLRDLGGLIVIDFIDMDNPRNQREVENRLRDALRFDRARVQTGKISRFGLLELSRQRLRPALAETSYITCPRCTGTGHIRSTESAALHILRILEEESMKENTGALHTQVPVDVATFLLNEKRDDIAKIELRHKVNLLIIPNRHLETPQHEIIRLRHDQLNQEEITLPSYRMAAAPTDPSYTPPSANLEAKAGRQEAAVKTITPGQAAPIVETRVETIEAAQPKKGLFARFLAWLGGSEEAAPAPVAPAKSASSNARRDSRRRDGRDGGRDGERKPRDGQNKQREERKPREGQAERQPREERAPREDRQPREDRKERGNRQDGQRQGNDKRTRTDAAPVTEAVEGQAAAQNKPRRERPPREPREPREPRDVQPVVANAEGEQVADSAPVAEGATPAANGEREGGRRRNRRGRGGRGRGEGEQSAATADNENAEGIVESATEANDQAEQSVETAFAPQAESSPAAPAESNSPAPAAQQELGFAAAEPVVPAPIEDVASQSAVVSATEEPVPVPEAAPAAVETVVAAPAAFVEAAPVAVEATVTTYAPVAPPVARSPIDLSAFLADNSLEMVETAPGAKATAPAQHEEQAQPARRPRERRVVVQAQDEPLQQVETRS